MPSRPLVWSLLTVLVVAALGMGATFMTGTRPLLGLDLKGGVSVVERPQGRVDSGILQEAVSIIDHRVNGLGVSNSDVTRQGTDIVIELPGAKNDTQVLKIVGQTAQLFFRPVECQIAAYVAPAPAKKTTTPSGTTTTTRPATTKSQSTTTTSRARFTKGGSTTSPSRAATTKAAAGSGTQWRLASATFPLSAGTTTSTAANQGTTTSTTAKAGASTSTTAKRGATTSPTRPVTSTTSAVANLCSDSVSQQSAYPTTQPSKDSRDSYVILPYYAPNYGYRYDLGPAEMTGSIVKTSVASLDPTTDEWEVDLTFTASGSTQFDNYAAPHYQCYEQYEKNQGILGYYYCAQQAIELDGVVESSPLIEAQAFNGRARISGDPSNPFTQTQASDLALALRYGSLPVRFTPQDINNVSPTIGTDSLVDGAIAGLVAVIAVLVYLVIYYRALGLVVLLGICMSGALVYAITTLLSQTNGLALTLSGVIGLIVSVGVTADSCVVYFERLKEEIRSGRTVRTSVEKGFNRAFRTILAADFSSFVAAMILYALTVGDIRGFAFFLGLATLLNVVTTYLFTRPLVILMGRRSSLTEGGFFGIGRGLGFSAFSTP